MELPALLTHSVRHVELVLISGQLLWLTPVAVRWRGVAIVAVALLWAFLLG
jgi:hypothetical protein